MTILSGFDFAVQLSHRAVVAFLAQQELFGTHLSAPFEIHAVDETSGTDLDLIVTSLDVALVPSSTLTLTLGLRGATVITRDHPEPARR